MATGHTNYSTSRQPPLKGSFPLDREGACKELKTIFLNCLKANGQENAKCILESKNYLSCRMDKNLMEKESLDLIGFKTVETAPKLSKEVKTSQNT